MPVAILTLAAAMAIGAVGASGAQALTWHHSGSSVLSGTESESVASSLGTINVSTTMKGAQVQFGCTATSTGSIAAAGGGTSTISLSKCTVSKPSSCEMTPTPLQANIALVEAGGGVFQKFTPAGGSKSFNQIEFTGFFCPLAESVASLKGSFAGRELSSGMAVNHTLSFTKGEGEPWPAVALTFGSEPATMTGSLTQHLGGIFEGGNWRAALAWELETGLAFAASEPTEFAGGPVKFEYYTAGALVQFTCGGVSSKEALLIPGGTESINSLKFSGCKFEGAASSCELTNGEMNIGPVTGTLMRVSGKTYERFTPTGARFGWVTVVGCSLGGVSQELNGSFAALGSDFAAMKTFHKVEFSDAANAATSSELLLGGGHGVHTSGTVQQEVSSHAFWNVFN